MKHYEYLSYQEIKSDLQSGKCKKLKGFYIYPDKIINYTDHYGFRIVKGTYDSSRGYIVTTPKTLVRYSVARLKAEAFLTTESYEQFFVDFKDGDPHNDNLDNLSIRMIQKKFCKTCGKQMKYDAQHEHCLKCRMENDHLQKVTEKELEHRKKLFKGININVFEGEKKERIKLYLEGWTLSAIAKRYNISRQAVDQLIKNSAKCNPELKKIQRKLAKTEKEINRLNTQLERYQLKVKRCQEELNAKQKYYESLVQEK